MKLSLNIVSEPASLDVRRMRNLADINVANMIYEGLFRITSDGPTQALAESYFVDETETIYRFKLRKAHWSNGKPITAEDFVQSYRSSLDPEFPSDYAFLLYYIKGAEKIKKFHQDPQTLGVRAIDESTLEIELNHPVPFLFDILCLPIFFPISENEAIFNGPFSLFNWRHNYQISLTKNTHYWDKAAVKLDKVDLYMCESETGMQMFEKGELDWEGDPFGIIPPDSFQNLSANGQLQLTPICATQWIRVNTSKQDLHNPIFRKAIATAIHRKDVSDHVLFKTEPATVRICPHSNAKEAYADGAFEMSKQLLLTAQQTKVHSLCYKSTPFNHRVAQAIQAQLDAIGIKIVLERLESKVFFSRVSKKDYDLALGNWYADVPDPMNFLQNFRTIDTGTNNTCWENASYKELLDKSELSRGEERMKLLEAAETILLEECPVIPLFQKCMQYVKNPRLKEANVSHLGILDIKHAYFSDAVDNEESKT